MKSGTTERPGTLVLSDPKFLEHDPGPGHVESPARLDAILAELARAPIDGVHIARPRCLLRRRTEKASSSCATSARAYPQA